ncbi:MAG: hypoxanthine phosphoribosyltransferase [Clostridia bacterium]|nr:hypoxanthine phosphoribosyltransferase [Clostridia bacterium]
MKLHKDAEKILISEAELSAKVKELGEQITRDFEGKNPVLVCILKGSVVFMADLMRAIDLDVDIDFMVVSSYGAGTSSKGHVKIVKDLSVDIHNRHVIIIEDILDSGNTLSNLIKLLDCRGAASIRLCALLNKPDRRTADVTLDYEGFVIPDEFVIGYGLDYNETYRNLPYVAILKEKIYAK